MRTSKETKIILPAERQNILDGNLILPINPSKENFPGKINSKTDLHRNTEPPFKVEENLTTNFGFEEITQKIKTDVDSVYDEGEKS